MSVDARLCRSSYTCFWWGRSPSTPCWRGSCPPSASSPSQVRPRHRVFSLTPPNPNPNPYSMSLFLISHPSGALDRPSSQQPACCICPLAAQTHPLCHAACTCFSGFLPSAPSLTQPCSTASQSVRVVTLTSSNSNTSPAYGNAYSHIEADALTCQHPREDQHSGSSGFTEGVTVPLSSL
jgi:hypothetical protein